MSLHLSFEAIGTHWKIDSDSPLSVADDDSLQAAIMQRIEAFDTLYSRFRNDSLVTQMSRKAGVYELPRDGYALLHFYEQLYELTEGKVTPLIGQVMSDAGYDAQYSFREGALAEPPKWHEVLEYNQDNITLRQPALLDFGAAGKGYLVDIVGSLLNDAGLNSYSINAGGDISHHSTTHQSLTVGLENPLDTEQVIGVVEISNQSICASAGNKRTWGNFTHIIDPHALASPVNVQATWVIADSAMLADGIATALFFCDANTLRKHFEFSYAILRNDMSLEYDHEFAATLNEA